MNSSISSDVIVLLADGLHPTNDGQTNRVKENKNHTFNNIVKDNILHLMNDGGKGTNTSVRESKTSTFNRISSEFITHTA